MKKALQRYFKEKNLNNDEWIIKKPNVFAFIDSKTVQKIVVEDLSEEQQMQIWSIIQQIDYHNGDVNHFLHHLANGLAETHSYLLNRVLH